MAQPHGNQVGEFPRAAVVFGQNRPVVGRVLEDADTSDLLTREIPHGCARADQTPLSASQIAKLLSTDVEPEAAGTRFCVMIQLYGILFQVRE